MLANFSKLTNWLPPSHNVVNAITQTVIQYPFLTTFAGGITAAHVYHQYVTRTTQRNQIPIPSPSNQTPRSNLARRFTQTPLRPLLPVIASLTNVPLLLKAHQVLPNSLFFTILSTHSSVAAGYITALWQPYTSPPLYKTDLAIVTLLPPFCHLYALAIYATNTVLSMPYKFRIYAAYIAANTCHHFFRQALYTIPRRFTSTHAVIEQQNMYMLLYCALDLSQNIVNIFWLSLFFNPKQLTIFSCALSLDLLHTCRVLRTNLRPSNSLQIDRTKPPNYYLPILALLPCLQRDLQVAQPIDPMQQLNNTLVNLTSMAISLALFLPYCNQARGRDITHYTANLARQAAILLRKCREPLLVMSLFSLGYLYQTTYTRMTT